MDQAGTVRRLTWTFPVAKGHTCSGDIEFTQNALRDEFKLAIKHIQLRIRHRAADCDLPLSGYRGPC